MASPVIPSSTSAERTEAGPTPATRRKVLGEPSSSRTTRSGVTRVPSASDDVFSAPAQPRPNARLPVFVDPSGDAENDPDQATNPTPWPELGTRKSRIKENTVEVSKAAGTTLRHAGRATRAASGSRIAVFRDPAPSDAAAMPPPPVPAAKRTRSASKSSIAVFRDESGPAAVGPSEAAKKVKGRNASKSSITIFKDEEAATPEPAKKGKSRSESKSSIAVFRDDNEAENTPDPATKGKTRTASKSSIVVFRDGEEPGAKATPAVPSTPKFVPFRDEEEVRFRCCSE